MKQLFFLCTLFFYSCKVVKPVTHQNDLNSEPGIISVQNYYSAGDKSWSPAFKKAIRDAQIQGSKSVFIPSGEYTIDSQINVPKDVDLIGQSMSNTIIKAKDGDYSEAIIRVSGANISKLSLKVKKSLKAYDRKFEVSNAGSLKKGDVLLLRSNRSNSWGAGFEKGEYIKVQSISRNVVTLFGQIYDDYSKEELEIYLYQGTRSSIRNLKVIGLPSKMLACIRIEGGLENNIRDLKLEGSGYAGIVTILGFNQLFDNIHAEKSEDDKGKGYSYGMNIGNSQNIKVSNCNLYGVRHGLTFGGAGSLKIPNRLNICISSTLSSSINYAASFHPNSEFCSYISCHILGGALIRGKSNTIDGCTIFNLQNETDRSNEHTIHFSTSILDLNHIISNNRLILKKSKNELLLSYQDSKDNYLEGGTIIIKDNVMEIYNEKKREKPSVAINLNFKNTSISNALTFSNNHISASKGSNTFQIRSFNNKNLENLVIDNNYFTNVGMHIESVNTCIIRNNVIIGRNNYAISIHQKSEKKSNIEDILISNNKLNIEKGFFINLIGSKEPTQKLNLMNNDFSQSNSKRNKNGIRISNIKILNKYNNTVEGVSDNSLKGLAVFKNVLNSK